MIVEKMHGCGNDFCVIKHDPILHYSSLAIQICNRKTGIGADGLIVVKENPLEMIFYNADGSKAPMCGNGIRCFAMYALEHNLIRRSKFDVITGAGTLSIEIMSEIPFLCKVYMGEPCFKNSMLYISDELDSFGRILQIEDSRIPIYSLFMGTIHTVVFVPDFESSLFNLAEKIESHPLFHRKTNVNFVQVVDKKTIKVKTYERGVGWTLACGTGCCAAVVTANKLGFVKNEVTAILEMGFLDIELKKNKVYMTGPAVKVFECNYEEEKDYA